MAVTYRLRPEALRPKAALSEEYWNNIEELDASTLIILTTLTEHAWKTKLEWSAGGVLWYNR